MVVCGNRSSPGRASSAGYDDARRAGPSIGPARMPSAMAPDGTPYFSVINFLLGYRGIAEVHVVTSHDRGTTWQDTMVDTSEPPPGCAEASGCGYGFLSTTAGLAVDKSGKLLLAYNAGNHKKEPQKMWIKTSEDGANWTPRLQISQRNDEASNGFPSVAAGPLPGATWNAAVRMLSGVDNNPPG